VSPWAAMSCSVAVAPGTGLVDVNREAMLLLVTPPV